jgi:CubicO group peptidase (beta-lactamase class C family)
VLSITKVLAGLACAKASGEGWLSADEKVAVTISEWQGDPGKESVTVRMLLQMTAGLEDSAKVLYRRDIADKGKVAVALRLVDPPGSTFRYGPACWEVLAELLHRKAVARGETLEKFLHRGVMRPIGLHSRDWRSDGKGRFFLSTGAELRVTDLGRLGRTLLDLLSGRDAAGIAVGDFR